VYRIAPDGKSTVIFQPQELQVQAIVVGKDGAIYAATNPDGKIYRLQRGEATAVKPAKDEKDKTETQGLENGWSSSVFFDPGTKYIWDLALDAAGNLYVATGDHGEIFRVTPKGEHSVFFKSDEAHVRVLAFDAKGNLIAGSDGSGLIYRITPSGESFVLYSAPKKEITALAIDLAGNIYAAGVGEKRPSAPVTASFPVSPSATPSTTPASGAPHTGIRITGAAPNVSPIPGAFPFPGMAPTGGSEIYRIAPDGSPITLWSSRDDLVYALGFNQRGTLLAATGNKGHIYAIAGEDDYVDLVKASAGQVTAFGKASGGGLYASTSNLGKIFLLGPSSEPEGSYESDVFDARIFSRWGRLESRSQGNIELAEKFWTGSALGAVFAVEGRAARREPGPSALRCHSQLSVEECGP
jgi:sugar lactone lactonase YvrE